MITFYLLKHPYHFPCGVVMARLTDEKCMNGLKIFGLTSEYRNALKQQKNKGYSRVNVLAGAGACVKRFKGATHKKITARDDQNAISMYTCNTRQLTRATLLPRTNRKKRKIKCKNY